jgi:hypothetical protein
VIGMAYREFVDSRNVVWRVWSTVPAEGGHLHGGFQHGWLTFESGAELRRLTPIPANWETAPRERLEVLCRDARDVQRRLSGQYDAVMGEDGASAHRHHDP